MRPLIIWKGINDNQGNNKDREHVNEAIRMGDAGEDWLSKETEQPLSGQ